MLYDPKWEVETRISPVGRVLIDARRRIESETNWCQTFSEERIGPDGAPYVAICAVHAIRLACQSLFGSDKLEGPAVYALADVIGVDRFGPDVGRWNDTHPHHSVLAAFDRAIVAAANA